MDIKDFTEKVLNKFTKEITDEIFCYIENDRELMHDYLRLLNTYDLNSLNTNIAKYIKKKYDLTNLNIENDNPKSKLIKSFQQFKK